MSFDTHKFRKNRYRKRKTKKRKSCWEISSRLAKRGVFRFDTHSPAQLLREVTLGYSLARKPMLQTKVHIQSKRKRGYINVSTMTGIQFDPIGPAQPARGLPTPFPDSQSGGQESILKTCSGGGSPASRLQYRSRSSGVCQK